MNKNKILTILGLLIFLLGIPAGVVLIKQSSPFKLGAQNANQPTNVLVSAVTDQGATITWTTEKASQGMISYGLFPANLTLIQPETGPTTTHRINLLNLIPQSNYYFAIKEGDQIYDNEGKSYTFTTLAKTTTTLPLTDEGLQTAMETNDPDYDLNHDGIVNSFDLQLFRQR